MNWLTRVRNSLPFGNKRETADNLWVKCPNCKEMLFTKEFEENQQVCPRCDHHGRIGADERLNQLLDLGYDLLEQPEVKEDPLKFRDQKKYTDRLKEARAKNPHRDAFSVGSGQIEGHDAVVGVQDVLKGQVPRGLVVLKAGVDVDPDELAAELVSKVRAEIGAVAALREIDVVQALPKTRSGKILRGTMVKIADGAEFKMPATIDDPAILDEIKEALQGIGYAKG